jgi:hypothetical protein
LIPVVSRDGIEPPTRGFSKRAGEAAGEENVENSGEQRGDDHAEQRGETVPGRSRVDPESARSNVSDPVEAALTVALEGAAKAGEWTTVATAGSQGGARERREPRR